MFRLRRLRTYGSKNSLGGAAPLGGDEWDLPVWGHLWLKTISAAEIEANLFKDKKGT
jgi:hypothetical protein